MSEFPGSGVLPPLALLRGFSLQLRGIYYGRYERQRLFYSDAVLRECEEFCGYDGFAIQNSCYFGTFGIE